MSKERSEFRVFKCTCCKGDIIISLPYSKKYVQRASKWYHLDCLKESLPEKTRVNFQALVDKTKPVVENHYYKHKIYNLLVDHYNCSMVPNSVFVKLQQIYDGTYPGLAIPIPPEDLIDMLERKMPYLDKNAAKKKMSGVSRFSYDLAVVMSKYNSYLDWKAACKAEEEEMIEAMNLKKQTVQYIHGYIPPSRSDNDDDISDILDDIMD